MASRDPSQVAVQSRLVADVFVGHYEALIPKHARGALLDHGCGQLPLFGIYKDIVSEVTAVDWSYSQHPTNHVDTYCDLNYTMPFPDARFDTVLSSDVIEHLWNPIEIFRDIARVLKPGGKLIVGTPFNYWLHEAPYDYFRWSPYAVEKIGNEVGLELIELRLCGGNREVLADTLLKSLDGRIGCMFAGVIDTVLRWFHLVSLTRQKANPMTLGTVAVLQRRPRQYT